MRRACHTEGSVPYLMALEEGRDFQGFSNGLQSVPVGDLRTEGNHSFTYCVCVCVWYVCVCARGVCVVSDLFSALESLDDRQQ